MDVTVAAGVIKISVMEVFMKHLIQDILRGKNLEGNLKKYKDLAVSAYMEYAALELTFSAYTMVQELVEEKPDLAQKEGDIAAGILQALGMLGSGSADDGALIRQMQGLRQEITDKMDLFTCYTDRLLVYEYVLNRMELKFLPEKELNKRLADFDEDLYMQQLSEYLFSDRDQGVIREKVHLVLGQIPVHMTRSKFSQRVSEALTLYRDGDRMALDDFIYMIRTAAMVYEPARYVGEYPDFEDILHRLASAEYTGMTEDAYQELTGLLEEGARRIHEITDFYYSLQKVVNGIYAICLLHTYQGAENKLLRACRSIWVCLAKKEYRDEMLEPLEGRIEDQIERTSYLETVLFDIKNSRQTELAELGMTRFFEDIAAVANLLSDSLFIDLERVAKGEKADAAYVRERTEELLGELMQKLGEVSRPVKRAIMGQVLEKLPLMSGRPEEIQEYIQVNLMGCQDKAEKCVVMMILKDLMREEYTMSAWEAGNDSLV